MKKQIAQKFACPAILAVIVSAPSGLQAEQTHCHVYRERELENLEGIPQKRGFPLPETTAHLERCPWPPLEPAAWPIQGQPPCGVSLADLGARSERQKISLSHVSLLGCTRLLRPPGCQVWLQEAELQCLLPWFPGLPASPRMHPDRAQDPTFKTQATLPQRYDLPFLQPLLSFPQDVGQGWDWAGEELILLRQSRLHGPGCPCHLPLISLPPELSHSM